MREMKLRHAAALALAVWYLVDIPDQAELKELKYPPQYEIWDTYSDKSSCERDRPEFARVIAGHIAAEKHKVEETVSCVMPDDPSLKGKIAVRRVK